MSEFSSRPTFKFVYHDILVPFGTTSACAVSTIQLVEEASDKQLLFCFLVQMHPDILISSCRIQPFGGTVYLCLL